MENISLTGGAAAPQDPVSSNPQTAKEEPLAKSNLPKVEPPLGELMADAPIVIRNTDDGPPIEEKLSTEQAAVLSRHHERQNPLRRRQSRRRHPRTVYRWQRQNPQYIAALNAWQQQTTDSARNRLLAMADKAVVAVHSALLSCDARTAMSLLKNLGILQPPTARQRGSGNGPARSCYWIAVTSAWALSKRPAGSSATPPSDSSSSSNAKARLSVPLGPGRRALKLMDTSNCRSRFAFQTELNRLRTIFPSVLGLGAFLNRCVETHGGFDYAATPAAENSFAKCWICFAPQHLSLRITGAALRAVGHLCGRRQRWVGSQRQFLGTGISRSAIGDWPSRESGDTNQNRRWRLQADCWRQTEPSPSLSQPPLNSTAAMPAAKSRISDAPDPSAYITTLSGDIRSSRKHSG